MSNAWWACLTSETRPARAARRGMSFSISVVLPLPCFALADVAAIADFVIGHAAPVA